MKNSGMRGFACALGLATSFALRAAPSAAEASWPDPVDSPAQIVPLAAQSLLLGLARTANGYVAVGGRDSISDLRVIQII